MKKGLFSILLLLIVFYSANGQDVKVRAAFDTTRILIGDQVRFVVTVDQPNDIQLKLPEFSDTLVKNIDILSGPVIDTLRNLKDAFQIKRIYLITSFDSGRYQIPPVYAELKNEAGLKRFYSDYSYLEVLRPEVAPADTTAKIFDIVAPYRAPITLGELLPWILLLILITAIVYYAVRLYRKYRNRKIETEVPVFTDPAHIIAFRELEKLKEEKLWQKGEVKLYYSRLTEILRQYLENRFRVYSLELTTSETLESLLATGFKKNNSYDKLKTVLYGADMVKFAKYAPEPTENEVYFLDAWSFITETKVEDTSLNEPIDTENKEGGAK